MRGKAVLRLAWLANELPRYGHQLKAGQFVTTEVCMNVYTAQPNEQIVADFGSLGTVETIFVANESKPQRFHPNKLSVV